MKYTQYFLATRERGDRKDIKLEWIAFIFNNPEQETIQTDGRIKRWAYIEVIQKIFTNCYFGRRRNHSQCLF